jgi:hypothetical protein
MKELIVATLCGLLLLGIAGCAGDSISDSSPAVQAFHRGGGGGGGNR